MFGKTIDAQSLIDLLKIDDNAINKLFNFHDLLGILLGYGTHNAFWFQEEYQDSAAWYFLKEEERLTYHSCLVPSNNLDIRLCLVSPVNFGFDPHHEPSRILKKKYINQHKNSQKSIANLTGLNRLSLNFLNSRSDEINPRLSFSLS